MSLPPEAFPLPRSTAGRIGLTVEEQYERGRHSSWSYGPGSLGDHAALAFYRFVPVEPPSAPYKDDYATRFVQAVALRFSADRDGRGRQPWHAACRDASARQLAAVSGFKGLGRPVRAGARTTATRLLVGMGYKNALEVGMTFHHPGGFPYLPGTSVKGLARAWAETVEEAAPADVRRIFGSATKRVDESDGMVAGSVAFLDALPTRFPPLEADLLNPHVGDYYMKDGVAPADWLSPKPVPFLAVGAGAVFQFALVGRDRLAYEDVKTAWSWLMDALTDLGAGGKTAAGYGVFVPGEPGTLAASPVSTHEARAEAAPAVSAAASASALPAPPQAAAECPLGALIGTVSRSNRKPNGTLDGRVQVEGEAEPLRFTDEELEPGATVAKKTRVCIRAVEVRDGVRWAVGIRPLGDG